MKKNGTGGNSTLTGLKFEKDTDLAGLLANRPGYSISNDVLFYQGEQIAELCKGRSLYRFLERKGVRWQNFISQQLLPDEAIYIYSTKTLIVIEKKYQQSPGSVDEKIQTCDFKRRQYQKLISPLGLQFKMIYVLNDWFKNPRYADPLTYIKMTGSEYYFNVIPLSQLGLPR